ncbi:type II membrane protein [Rhizina undulata]
MRINHHLSVGLLALPSLVTASFHCKVVQDGITFDMTPLKGGHSVWYTEETDPTITNTTWTINPCGPLKKSKEEHPKDQCPNGTQVCGIERVTTIGDNSTTIVREIIPIAGDFGGKRGVDPIITRLKTSNIASDAGREGLRVILHGGEYVKKRQEAVVEFLCDHERTGLEGSEPEDEGGEDSESVVMRAAEEQAEEGGKDDKASLQFISYNKEDPEKDVLHLQWRTKYACEDVSSGGGSGDSGSSWGFFTWFIIIAFLGIAAYLIFGSWFNYNRYGTKGWNMLPHGDTIREMPYLMKEWGKKVMETIQGRGGSRGGYSAV